MKNFIKAFRLTVVMCVLLGVGYVFVLWVFGKVAGPGNGNAETVVVYGKVVGAANVGQQFTKDIYFWGRPSCAGNGYDAANSCGSNKGPTNPEYLAEVKARIDTFLVHHPYLKRKDVPAEMVTASGSGLDPSVSPCAGEAGSWCPPYRRTSRGVDCRAIHPTPAARTFRPRESKCIETECGS